ncbi:MAG TPA: carboxypeptidase-like regulatory domain-containing protein, partial [Bryobacteraceae bacterium]|nr:carboxypeptidase-like regulatory domain-containing protein [Bryobacteraceae bacterium]
MKQFKAIALLLCVAGLTFAQNVSSSLRGVVVDPSGGAIPGAECVLVNQGTGAAISVTSDSQGNCVFPTVQAGTYNLTVKMSGFKSLESKDIVVTASQ